MKRSPRITEDEFRVAREAKALVALAFRNGPIEDVHAAKNCPTCQGDPRFSHITQAEMRRIMKAAVDRPSVYFPSAADQELLKAAGQPSRELPRRPE
jgi:hypothetical protein